MPTLEIASVFSDPKYKTGSVSFTKDPEKKFKFWADAPFKDALKVGASADAVFKHEPAKGEFPAQDFLVSWDGVAMPEKQKFGGGGGGYKPSPKTPQEIHSASVCGLLKSCVESGTITREEAGKWIDLYVSTMERFK